MIVIGLPASPATYSDFCETGLLKSVAVPLRAQLDFLVFGSSAQQISEAARNWNIEPAMVKRIRAQSLTRMRKLAGVDFMENSTPLVIDPSALSH
jgi:hypothetical protein